MAYDKNKDYQKEINDAVSVGDYQLAAVLEQRRNEKIVGEGRSEQQTNNYSKYLQQENTQPSSGLYDTKTNYKGLLDSAINAGSTDADYLQGLLNSRMAKVQDQNYAKYDDPNYHAYVQSYINDLKSQNNTIDLDEIMNQIYGQVGQAPTYSSPWDRKSNDLANAAINMNYNDWLAGPDYGALSERYAQSGKRAMKDTLGQMAARTGGLASSYAEAVAQQQYNDYMSKLEDAARSMYSAERGDIYQNAQLAASMANNDYNRYRDSLSQYNTDRDYVTSVLNNALSRQDSSESRRLDIEDRDYDRAVDKAKTLAAAGDYSGYSALGYNADEVAKLQSAYDQAQADAAAKAYKGNGGGKDTGKSSGYETALSTAKGKKTAKEAYDYLDNQLRKGNINEDEFLIIFEDILGYNVDDFGSDSSSDKKVQYGIMSRSLTHPQSTRTITVR